MTSDSVHVPVLLGEILELGQPRGGQTWIDGTAGGGGHSLAIAQRIESQGHLLAIDRDPQVVDRLSQMFGAAVAVRHASYDTVPNLLADLAWPLASGILLDLGLSSDQLSDRKRGFSFQGEGGELDMRFDPTSGEPAWEWLSRVDEKTLADTIYRYGEERFSRRIAKNIVNSRKAHPLRTPEALRELIYRSVPAGRPSQYGRRHGRIDPATRTFQALRIAVNDELAILERAMSVLPDCLEDGGKLMVISFHSLEDRIVKYAFRGDQRLQIVTRRPVQASEEEIAKNPRSRSAKLRVATRVPREIS